MHHTQPDQPTQSEEAEPITRQHLEAGAGTGRDTKKLLDRLPRGRIVAADASVAMLDQLRSRIGHEPRLHPLQWDLSDPLPAELGLFDAVLSVATFHWIFDHQRLFNSIGCRMVGSGTLVSECGGRGNVQSIDDAVAKALGTPREQPWHFADVDSTRRRLMEAGFDSLDITLRPHPITLHEPELFRTYLGTIVLGSYLDDMDADEGREFLSAVTSNLDEPTVDYVRLEILARKTGPRSTP